MDKIKECKRDILIKCWMWQHKNTIQFFRDISKIITCRMFVLGKIQSLQVDISRADRIEISQRLNNTG